MCWLISLQMFLSPTYVHLMSPCPLPIFPYVSSYVPMSNPSFPSHVQSWCPLLCPPRSPPMSLPHIPYAYYMSLPISPPYVPSCIPSCIPPMSPPVPLSMSPPMSPPYITTYIPSYIWSLSSLLCLPCLLLCPLCPSYFPSLCPHVPVFHPYVPSYVPPLWLVKDPNKKPIGAKSHLHMFIIHTNQIASIVKFNLHKILIFFFTTLLSFAMPPKIGWNSWHSISQQLKF